MRYVIHGLLFAISVSLLAIIVASGLYQRRLMKHRGVSREEFIKAFASTDIPSEISAAVYDFYKSGVLAKGFGVAPDDDFELVLSEEKRRLTMMRCFS